MRRLKDSKKNLKIRAKKLLRLNKFLSDNPKYKQYRVGRFSYGEPKIKRWGKNESLTIGSFCSFASNVTILLGGNHRVDWITTYPFTAILPEFQNIHGHPATKGDVIIGNDVWIGMDTLILSGVRIGDGAVVGARSVVTKDVEPYTIVAGNPAKTIKKRFDQQKIDELLRIKWWEWDIEKIKENMPLLLSGKTKEFVEKNRDR